MPNISFVGAKKRKTRHPGWVFTMSRRTQVASQPALAKCKLLSLVDELLLNIIDHTDCRKALCNLAATCTRFQGLAEPYIWRSLLVLTGGHARKIAAAFDSWDARVDFVQEMSVRYQDNHKEGIEDLNHFVGLMAKLRHLTLESPCPNNSEWNTVSYFDGWSRIDYTNLLAGSVYPRMDMTPTLPMLQSLTLHGHGPDNKMFVLERRAAAMFLHPTLRKITISCLNFDTDIELNDIPIEKHKSTPLQSLTLIECNVNVRYLDVVLSLPKALKELSINERLHSFPECRPSMDPKTRTSSVLFLTALQKQAGSLRSLVHIGGKMQHLTDRETDPQGSSKLRSLVELEHLELGFESHLYYYLRDNGFPPALKTLKMLDNAISIGAGHFLDPLLRIIFRSMTSLVTSHLPQNLAPGFTLHLMFSETTIRRLRVQNTIDLDLNQLLTEIFLDRPTVYKIADILKSYKSRFCITRESFPSGMGYIPPYMYGEELPVETVMYDSDDYWRFNTISFRAMDDEELKKELEKEKRMLMCQSCYMLNCSVGDCIFERDATRCSSCELWDRKCERAKDEDGSSVAQAAQ
ncbi:hypothetical protein P153DRAFT_372329 [Dothidotthia symphoricarpi CBS 119687]|uniref:F-box domain-containing protein n=1 Tax=Dothidotthia symphoricarpi CBS 119687 TaxID=1392245 RepID=A0A6A6AP89_9PLEO|nr:uncharacterized protein P153DRAFT_372329 [Dothidotthia symphoricarpi CBS 119687]KAF2133739.1 hypothetical protein P153DRAFT_372329 [Dothidotthia symphoricarpi CBS 119687]